MIFDVWWNDGFGRYGLRCSCCLSAAVSNDDDVLGASDGSGVHTSPLEPVSICRDCGAEMDGRKGQTIPSGVLWVIDTNE